MEHLQLDRRQQIVAIPDDSRDRLIRLEEGMKHIDKTLQEIRLEIAKQNHALKTEHKETVARVETLERRVDRIYWVWSALVFFGSPVMVVATKYLMTQFGI